MASTSIILVPTADVTTGNWTGTPDSRFLYVNINEGYPNHDPGSYIESLGNTSNRLFRATLGSLPPEATLVTAVTIRAYVSGTCDANSDVQFRLQDSSNVNLTGLGTGPVLSDGSIQSTIQNPVVSNSDPAAYANCRIYTRNRINASTSFTARHYTIEVEITYDYVETEITPPPANAAAGASDPVVKIRDPAENYQTNNARPVADVADSGASIIPQPNDGINYDKIYHGYDTPNYGRYIAWFGGTAGPHNGFIEVRLGNVIPGDATEVHKVISNFNGIWRFYSDGNGWVYTEIIDSTGLVKLTKPCYYMPKGANNDCGNEKLEMAVLVRDPAQWNNASIRIFGQYVYGSSNPNGTNYELDVDIEAAVPITEIIVTPSPAVATAGAVDPVVVLGSLTIAPTFATAATGGVEPFVILGSISLVPPPAEGTATGVDPTVVQGSTAVTPDAAMAVAGAVEPTVVMGSAVAAPAPAPAITSGLDPYVVQSALSITPAPAEAHTTGVDPRVLLDAIVLHLDPAIAATGGVDPLVLLGGVSATPSPAESNATAVDCVVILGGTSSQPVPGVAYATAVDPVVSEGELLVTPAAAVCVAAAVDPTVALIGDLVITPDPSIAWTDGVDPTVTIPASVISISWGVCPETRIASVTGSSTATTKVPAEDRTIGATK